jgi:hypothetical protein
MPPASVSSLPFPLSRLWPASLLYSSFPFRRSSVVTHCVDSLSSSHTQHTAHRPHALSRHDTHTRGPVACPLVMPRRTCVVLLNRHDFVFLPPSMSAYTLLSPARTPSGPVTLQSLAPGPSLLSPTLASREWSMKSRPSLLV